MMWLPKLVGPSTLASRPLVVAEIKRIASAQRPEAIVQALHLLRDRPDSRPTLATIQVPTLFMVGRDDALTPVSASESMVGQVKTSHLVILDDAGHLSNLEQPIAFNEVIQAVLT